MAVGSLIKALASLPVRKIPSFANRAQYNPIVKDLPELATKAFRDVEPEKIERASREVIARNPFPFVDQSIPGYEGYVANQQNRLALMEMLEQVGGELGVSSRQLRPMVNPRAAANELSNLDLTINMPFEAFSGMASDGRMKSAAELGGSRSLGLLPAKQRFKDIESPVFGATDESSSPFYGWLSRRPGSSPTFWETSRDANYRGQTKDIGRIYGEVGLRFGRPVRDDSSFFIGDSLLTTRGRGNGLPGGVGRRISGMTPEDVQYAGIHRLPDAGYIETQTWRPPRFDEIIGIDTPQYLVSDIQRLLSRVGLNPTINPY